MLSSFSSINYTHFPTTNFRTALASARRRQVTRLETRNTVLRFVRFDCPSIFASRCQRFVSGHVTASIGAASMAACPGNRMHWDITPDFIATESDELIAESKTVYDAVGALDSAAVTYDNVIKVFLLHPSLMLLWQRLWGLLYKTS